MNFFTFSCLCGIFVFLDPAPDSRSGSGPGSTDPIESGSETQQMLNENKFRNGHLSRLKPANSLVLRIQPGSGFNKVKESLSRKVGMAPFQLQNFMFLRARCTVLYVEMEALPEFFFIMLTSVMDTVSLNPDPAFHVIEIRIRGFL
jgi:hypothetical protein